MKNIDIQPGDKFGYMEGNCVLAQLRGRNYRFAFPEMMGLVWYEKAQTFTPVTRDVANAVLAATGYTILETPTPGEGVAWPTHAVRYVEGDGAIRVWGSDLECRRWIGHTTGYDIIKMPTPPSPDADRWKAVNTLCLALENCAQLTGEAHQAAATLATLTRSAQGGQQ